MKRTALLATVVLLAVSLSAQQPSSSQMMSTASSSDSSRALNAKEIESLIRKYPLDRIGLRGVGKGINIYSQHSELEMGQDAQQAIERSAKIIKDGPAIEYLREIGFRIAENSDAQRPYIFKVLLSREINAMALPNGTVYVNSGLLMAVQSEAELAGVLAHEIAHIAARHATKSATKTSFLNLAMLGASMFGGGIVPLAQPAAQMGVRGLMMKYSRDHEREADMLGMQYAYLAGYDPQAFLAFLERLKESEGPKRKLFERMMATHPSSSERVQRARAVIARILPPKEEYVLTSDGLADVQYIIGEVTGDHTRDGMTKRPVLHRTSVESSTAEPSSFQSSGAWASNGVEEEQDSNTWREKGGR